MSTELTQNEAYNNLATMPRSQKHLGDVQIPKTHLGDVIIPGKAHTVGCQNPDSCRHGRQVCLHRDIPQSLCQIERRLVIHGF